MDYINLGSTGLCVSRIAFGAGPVPEMMTEDRESQQRAIVQRALDAGINWFDTAATYGQGESERNLGRTLAELGASADIHVATKVRIMPDQADNLALAIRRSVANSLKRLQISQIALLQVHNSVTAQRGDEPTSLTPADILDKGGMLETFQQLRNDGIVRCLGMTGIGHADSLREVVQSGQLDTIQVPYNLLNPTAGRSVDSRFEESDYGNIIAESARQNMGVFAIRVFAGGALAGKPPSKHTHTTQFFPLELYARDQLRAKRLAKLLRDELWLKKMGLREELSVKEAAVRFVLSHPGVSSAIIGFGAIEQIDEAVEFAERGALPEELDKQLRSSDYLDHP